MLRLGIPVFLALFEHPGSVAGRVAWVRATVSALLPDGEFRAVVGDQVYARNECDRGVSWREAKEGTP